MKTPTRSRADKAALLNRAFQTEEGTQAAYKAAKLDPPASLAETPEERAKDFLRAMQVRLGAIR